MYSKNKTQFCDLEWAIPKIQRLFIKNRNRSISAAFRFFRNHSALFLIGDFPILAMIVNTIKDLKIPLKRANLFYALNQSTELKDLPRNDKQDLIDELLKPLSVQLPTDKTASRNDLFSNDDTLLIQTQLF